MPKEKDFLKEVLFSRFFLAVLIAFVFLIAVSTGRALWRKYQLDKEIFILKENIYEAEKKNQELLARLDYFKSEENLEKEARAHLNVKRPGEKVVVIIEKENENRDGSVEEKVEEKKKDFNQTPSTAKNNIPNPVKWWRYFFNN